MGDNLIMGMLFALAALAFFLLAYIAARQRNTIAAASCGAMGGSLAATALIAFSRL